MKIPSISIALPDSYCPQSGCNKCALITVIALGSIALLMGILLLNGIPDLHTLGTTCGATLTALGSLTTLIALCSRFIKIDSEEEQSLLNYEDNRLKDSASQSLDSELHKEPETILYMSISGNPAHMGHMSAIGTAIKELRHRNITIKKAFVSLSAQAYVEEKSQQTIDKICYSYEERIQFLNFVINQAKHENMFDSVDVEFWDDQAELGYSWHCSGYRELTRANPLNKITLITGSDLCCSMSDWKTENIAHAIIITRGTGDQATVAQKDSNGLITNLVYQPTGEPFVTAIDSEEKSRILLSNVYPEYENYSSTAIRTKKIRIPYINAEGLDKPQIKPVSQGTLQDISNNTMQLMEQGFCQISETQKISFKSGLELHLASSLFMYDGEIEPAITKFEQKIYVVENDSFDAAQKLSKDGHKVAVVNFAGSDSAGGGFLEGTAGQEEKLIYRCELANLMKYYYDKQLECDPDFKMYPLYDHLIHTPNIKVFRNSQFQVLEEPFTVGILTSAAPVSKNFCPFADTAFEIVIHEDEVDYAEQKTKDLMRKTIYTQLKAAYISGYDAIVLGAFGCGAFQNPPDAVSKIYHEVIDTYFKGAFKTIVFAILDGGKQTHNPKGNILPFKSYFPDETS